MKLVRFFKRSLKPHFLVSQKRKEIAILYYLTEALFATKPPYFLHRQQGGAVLDSTTDTDLFFEYR